MDLPKSTEMHRLRRRIYLHAGEQLSSTQAVHQRPQALQAVQGEARPRGSRFALRPYTCSECGAETRSFKPPGQARAGRSCFQNRRPKRAAARIRRALSTSPLNPEGKPAARTSVDSAPVALAVKQSVRPCPLRMVRYTASGGSPGKSAQRIVPFRTWSSMSRAKIPRLSGGRSKSASSGRGQCLSFLRPGRHAPPDQLHAPDVAHKLLYVGRFRRCRMAASTRLASRSLPEI